MGKWPGNDSVRLLSARPMATGVRKRQEAHEDDRTYE